MICPFCSLLCDAENLDSFQCDRRTASLVLFESLRFQKGDLHPTKQIDREMLLLEIESAMVSEIKKHFDTDTAVHVEIPSSGDAILATANGRELSEDELRHFGAPAAKQIIVQKIRETNNAASDDWLKEAIQLLRSAKRILVMGRIASVESARAVLAFASKHNATVDCAESGHVFKNVLAIQRSGLNSVSLAEARDHSDLFIVVGDDSMMAAVPRMPFALSNCRPGQQTALLLGDFSIAATEQWKKAGFDIWSVPCEWSSIPSALAHWSRWSESTDSKPSNDATSTNQLFERLARARYTTVVWSAETLQIDQADLWVERMLQWIASRNEDTRCAALPWTSLDGTFQQVCTWLTGFPGRIAFRDGVPEYDPNRSSYEQWIARTPIGKGHESVIVWIDETVASAPFWNPKTMQDSDNCKIIELSTKSEKFPTAIAGLEIAADMFRADQTLLAHVRPTHSLGPRTKPVSGWLEALSK